MTKDFLTVSEEQNLVKAIQKSEKNTSGEIRVHIEQKTEKPALERAKEVFLFLNMHKTEQRNGVLFYVGVQQRQFAIVGDEGINKLVPTNFWEEEQELVTQFFIKKEFEKGLIAGILKVGEKLKEYFPYTLDDSNELSDAISKG